jgi:hypothetical protein
MMAVTSFAAHDAQVPSNGRSPRYANQQSTAMAVIERIPVTTPRRGMAISHVSIAIVI